MQKIEIGLSPCPNDTFMFYALLHKKIDTNNWDFIPLYADIEQLNEWAMQQKLLLSKLSFHAYLYCRKFYTLMNSGAALGRACGPLLITKINTQVSDSSRIAIPGFYTTAHLLFKYFYPQSTNKKFVVFHEVEQLVSDGDCDMGVIIHENRFTYQDKGLQLICDLGDKWEQETKLPIPLGGIFIHNEIASNADEICNIIRESILYALSHKQEVMTYCSHFAQEMNEEVLLKHIQLYVNDYSIDIGLEGYKAISKLESRFVELTSSL